MSAPTGISSGVGFRNVVLFELNAAGLPKATAAAAYEGYRISGAKAMTLNDPEPRRITHVGDDGIITVDVLPSTEAISGEVRTGKLNGVVDAVLSGQKQFVVGEAQLIGVGTDKRGFEPQVGLLAYRQAQDTDPDSSTFGLRVWDFRILPKATLISRESGYSDTPEEHIYTVVPAKVSAHLWGTVFSESTEGFLRGAIVRGISFGKPKIVAFLGDGTTTLFNLPAGAPALSTSKITVWKNGTLVSAGITKTTTSLTFTTAPALNDLVVAFYEY